MGLPAMNIVFVARALESIKRSERGALGMVLKDTAPEINPVVIYDERKDIPTTLSDASKEQIKLAMVGNVRKPSKVVAYVLPENAVTYEEALKYFNIHKVPWMCFPSIVEDGQEETVEAWVKIQREGRNKTKAVLPEAEGDSEGIINFATNNIVCGEKTYMAADFCSRIAGLLAGTPSTRAVTFSALNDVSSVEDLGEDATNAAIDAGKFVLFYDGEKVKCGRGVNSLKTVKEGKSEAWKKIICVETMDMINDDLTILAEDHYIGKYRNTYSNKLLLISAIKAYMEELARAGIIENYVVDLDVEAIKNYLVSVKGIPRGTVEEMPEAEIKRQYTDEKVFLLGVATVVDVMEDITLKIMV